MPANPTSQTLKYQAAQAFKNGDFALMHKLDRQAAEAASEENTARFSRIQQKLARLSPPTAPVAAVAAAQTASRRIIRLPRK